MARRHRFVGASVLVLLLSAPTLTTDSAYEAARVALLALVTSSGGLVHDRYSLNGSEIDDVSSLTIAITRLPKPLMCRATSASRRLSITCTALPDPTGEFARELELISERYAQRILGSTDTVIDPSVLVHNQHDSIVVGLNALLLFVRNYVIPGSFGIDERGGEYAAVVGLRPPSPMEIRHEP